MSKLVFLGGTCGNNIWRESFIEDLTKQGVPLETLFNPVVENWNAEAQAAEDKAKREADYNLFFLGDPKQTSNHLSTYSMVEATMGLYDDPLKTLVVFDHTAYPAPKDQFGKVMVKIEKDLKARFPEANIFSSITDVEKFLVDELTRVEADIFSPGDFAKAKKTIDFVDGTKHIKGRIYKVTEDTAAYFNNRQKDYEKED